MPRSPIRTLHVCIGEHTVHVHATTRRVLPGRKGDDSPRAKTSRNGINVSLPKKDFSGHHGMSGSDLKMYVPEPPEGMDPLAFLVGFAACEMQKFCNEDRGQDVPVPEEADNG